MQPSPISPCGKRTSFIFRVRKQQTTARDYGTGRLTDWQTNWLSDGLKERVGDIPVEIVHGVARVTRHLEQTATGLYCLLYFTPVSVHFVIWREQENNMLVLQNNNDEMKRWGRWVKLHLLLSWGSTPVARQIPSNRLLKTSFSSRTPPKQNNTTEKYCLNSSLEQND